MTTGNTSPPPMSEESLARVREAVQAITGYHIGQPTEEALNDDTKNVHYCMSAQGVVEIRRNLIGRGTSIAKHVGGLPLVPCGFVMTLPKIPWEMFAQTVSFFRSVITRNGNRSLEAIVQFFFDPITQEYEIYIPPQVVSTGSVNHTGNGDPTGMKIHVGDIHSHGSSMSAFFSGTDDGDESRAERLYGVIGNVLDPMPTMKFRARVGTNFVDLQLGEMIAIPDDAVSIRVLIAPLLKARGAVQPVIDIFSIHPAPEEWLAQVSLPVPTVHHQHSGGHQSWNQHGYSGRGYNHEDAYFHQGGHRMAGFRPAWDRDRPEISSPNTSEGAILVSSSGKQYVDTAKGIFEINVGMATE